MNPYELNLQEFMFLHESEHEFEVPRNRTLILHSRTASVLEIFDTDNDEFALNPNLNTIEFKYKNENLLIVPHYTFAEDVNTVMDKAIKWYCDYCQWEDKHFDNEIKTTSN